jgi:hypothetical protein
MLLNEDDVIYYQIYNEHNTLIGGSVVKIKQLYDHGLYIPSNPPISGYITVYTTHGRLVDKETPKFSHTGASINFYFLRDTFATIHPYIISYIWNLLHPIVYYRVWYGKKKMLMREAARINSENEITMPFIMQKRIGKK